MHTMLDTPLVRGEREGLAVVGGVRLDMVRKQGCTLSDASLFKTLTCIQFAVALGKVHPHYIQLTAANKTRDILRIEPKP
jgi:hypothetical protein